MSFRFVFSSLLVLVSVSVVVPDLVAQDDNKTEPTEAQISFFNDEVLPILTKSCFKCHTGDNVKGKFHMDNRGALLAGGESGEAISVDSPEDSLLISAINYESFEMPPSGKLPQGQIDVLTKWVQMGAPFDPKAEKAVHQEDGPPQVNEETKSFWSYQKVTRPEIPKVKNKRWVSNAIDHFILAGLEDAKLKAPSSATKTAILRRAYYSLTGLPPSPEQVQAFLSDTDPNAWEKVIDELLASEHYGEHWGRHWLDLVRWAETNSYERDGNKPFIWRYRDYVIRSLNDDKPYNQFIMEQLAGDELDQVTADSITATGFYRLGTWQDEPVDRVQELYEDLDDIVRTTGEVFLGMTVGCARCHDHKLDPFPQADYYRFMSFFHGFNRDIGGSQVPIATPEDIQKQQAEITAHKAALEDLQNKIKVIEAIVIPDFQDVEKEEFKHEKHKIPLVKKRVPGKLSEEKFNEYVKLKEEEKKMLAFKPKAMSTAMAVKEIGRNAPETFVLIRGSAHARGDKVEPAFPSVLGFDAPELTPAPEGINSSGRRRVLAEWITSAENPLTARVIVNRLWQHHFGKGIVKSTSDFGFQGDRPTHPELLDFLASELMDGGWKLKSLHKQILMSSAFKMSSQSNAAGVKADPENKLIWRQEMRRLSAEEIRDTVLAVNGSLNPKMYGPSFYPLIPQEVKHGQSRPGAGWGNSSPEERARRGVYIFIKRSLPVPFIKAFDGADTDTTCPIRFTTTQPTQSLELMNGEFTNAQAKVFGNFLRENTDSLNEQIELALNRVFQRKPVEGEIQLGVDLVNTLKEENMDDIQALDYFCLVALNLNELLFLD